MIAACLSGVQLLASLVWLIVQPPEAALFYPQQHQVLLRCNVPDQWFLVSLVYDTALIVLCTVFAIKARKVPENFNEAKFIGFTMYTTCIIWLAFVPIYFGTGSDFQVSIWSLIGGWIRMGADPNEHLVRVDLTIGHCCTGVDLFAKTIHHPIRTYEERPQDGQDVGVT